MKMLTGLSLSAIVLFAAGCAHQGSHTAYRHGDRYYGQVDLDRALENRLRSEFNQYGQLGSAAANVQVSVQNGTVTLSGPVPTEQDRQMIDALARNTSGVASVIDQMQPNLPPTGIPGQPPRVYVVPPVDVRSQPEVGAGVSALGLRVQPATNQDRFLADQIADALRAVPLGLGPNDSVLATVRGPIVYLQGVIAGESERQSVRSAIQHTPGVSAVYDQ